jgi:hypothetical protein
MWLTDIASTTWHRHRQQAEAQALRTSMPLTAETNPSLDALPLESMRERVDAYVLDTLATLAGSGLTPSRIAADVDEAMGIYTRQIMWHNQALVAHHSPENPLSWDRFEAIRAERQRRFKRYGAHLTKHGAAWPAVHAYEDWPGLAHRRDQPEIGQMVSRLFDRLHYFDTLVNWDATGEESLERRIQDTIDQTFAKTDRYQASYDQGRLRITITEGPAALKGRSVVYGWLHYIDDTSHTAPEDAVDSRIIRIGGDLSDQYLQSRYQALPIIRPDRSK